RGASTRERLNMCFIERLKSWLGIKKNPDSKLNTGRWTETFLNEKRKRGDDSADRAVAAIVALPDGRRKLREAVTQLVENADVVLEKFDPAVRPIVGEYFRTTRGLPDWHKPELIALGEDVYESYGPEIGGILACASLPVCYGLHRDVQAIYFSGQ